MLPSRSVKRERESAKRMSSAATICVACGTAFDGDDGDGNAPTPAGKRHYDHGPQLVPMGVGRGVWACRETRVVVVGAD